MPSGIYERKIPVWNKGTKGICKPNSGSFKKGQVAYNKGTKGIMKANKASFRKGHPAPKTAFQKGQLPWNAGLSGVTKGNFKSGKLHPNWKGGKMLHGEGYILILKHNHPFCTFQGYILEHRLVMEKHIGRYLTRKEIVHHKGIKYPIRSIENKQDNRIENLQLFAGVVDHLKFHLTLKRLKTKHQNN